MSNRYTPASRALGLCLITVAVTAFVPHRERELLSQARGVEMALTTQALANSVFVEPLTISGAATDSIGASTLGQPGRQRFAPRRAGVVPPSNFSTPTLFGGPIADDSSGLVPLGDRALDTSENPTAAAGGGRDGVGPVEQLSPIPAGGGSGGGGNISSPGPGPIVPPVDEDGDPVDPPPVVVVPPPVSVVPEPATWAFMILGFGMIGAVLRRRKLMGIRKPVGRTAALDFSRFE